MPSYHSNTINYTNVQIYMKLRIAFDCLPASGIQLSEENFLAGQEQKQSTQLSL